MFIDVDAPKSFIGGAKIDHEIVDGVVDYWNDCDYFDKEEKPEIALRSWKGLRKVPFDEL